MAAGIDGYTLMQRAGERAYRVLRARWPEARSVTVCCGGGNNGGDGYVLARLARADGFSVQVIALKAPDELDGEAALAARAWLNAGGTVCGPEEGLAGEVVVDALLGTGLDRPARDDYAAMIDRVNAGAVPVLAVDVPSGLSADTGMPPGAAVRAMVTLSFIGRKRGLFTGHAGEFCGLRLFDDLDVPVCVFNELAPDAGLMTPARLRELLPPRRPSTHKGDLGHVLVAGGNRGMAGAALIAARAALRTGSGLVSVATREAHAAVLAAGQPEVMWHGVEADDDWMDWSRRVDVLALGPGLGGDDWAHAAWERLMADGRPLVLDADGLNRLAAAPRPRGDWILTPHPGEAARLLDTDAAEVQGDRFAAVRELAVRYDAVVVLKGHGSLVADPDGRVVVCGHGNPAMASAGMGDALTGIIASLRGQGLAAYEAAACGVLLHARAGDAAARGRRQIIAGDLVDRLADVLPV